MGWEESFLKSSYQVYPIEGTTMGTTTLEELNELGYEIQQERDEVRLLKESLKAHSKTLQNLEHSFIAHLEENKMEKYAVPGFGTCAIRKRFSYKVPQTPEERLQFFEYLKAKNVFEDLITVHSRTLNAWVKEELATATEVSDFEIPGLSDPTYSETLEVRK